MVVRGISLVAYISANRRIIVGTKLARNGGKKKICSSNKKELEMK
jgi:hypothetical protein